MATTVVSTMVSTVPSQQILLLKGGLILERERKWWVNIQFFAHILLNYMLGSLCLEWDNSLSRHCVPLKNRSLKWSSGDFVVFLLFNNGNWMECNLHMHDVKIERARSASSIWNHKNIRPKLHILKLLLYYIQFEIAQFNSLNTNYKILVSSIIYWTSSRFVKKTCQCLVNVMWLHHVIVFFLFLLTYSHWLKKRCDLEQKNSAICE